MINHYSKIRHSFCITVWFNLTSHVLNRLFYGSSIAVKKMYILVSHNHLLNTVAWAHSPMKYLDYSTSHIFKKQKPEFLEDHKKKKSMFSHYFTLFSIILWYWLITSLCKYLPVTQIIHSWSTLLRMIY